MINNTSLLLWISLCVIFTVCLLWHLQENSRLTGIWQRTLPMRAAEDLKRFAWSRSLQLLAVLACAIVIIIIYDWQLNQARKIAQEASLHASQQQAAAPSSSAPPPVQPQPDSYYPPVSSVPAPEVVVATAAPSGASPVPASHNAASTLADVYNPEANNTDPQSVIDNIKKRYEDILVTYFYLKQCGKSADSDYRIITSALGQEMASANAPGRLQYDIVTAAQGSYKEMYAKSPCAGQDFDALVKQYGSYVKTLSDQFPAQ